MLNFAKYVNPNYPEVIPLEAPPDSLDLKYAVLVSIITKQCRNNPDAVQMVERWSGLAWDETEKLMNDIRGRNNVELKPSLDRYGNRMPRADYYVPVMEWPVMLDDEGQLLHDIFKTWRDIMGWSAETMMQYALTYESIIAYWEQYWVDGCYQHLKGKLDV